MESLRDRLQLGAGALLIVLVGFLILHGVRCGGVATTHPKPPALRLEGKRLHFAIENDGTIVATSVDGASSLEAELVIRDEDGTSELDVVDASETDGGTTAFVELKNDHYDVKVTIGVDASTDTLTIAPLATVDDDGGPLEAEGGIGLSLDLAKRTAFLDGRGELADLASEHGTAVSVEGRDGPFSLSAAQAELSVDVTAGPKNALALVVTAAPAIPLTFSFAEHTAELVRRVGVLRQVDTKWVQGRVTGATGNVHVVGLDEVGVPHVRVAADEDGHFAVVASADVTEWYASEGTTRTSAPVHFPPGTGYDLVLDVSDGGELAIKIEDGDTHAPITARLVVHGIEGTLDPSFGPDYRASGAGPLIDALRGDVTTPVPAGKYRVLATKGMEWTVDSRIVEVKPGDHLPILLAPRHAIPSDALVGCDLHVHARPSFDSPVSTEDRVLSLVGAGVDFAVPSEHNIFGDYAPALDALGLTSELATVNGVEVTTYSPRFGHFGLFPYPPKSLVPPYRGSSPDRVFAAAHANDPDKKRILHVNHPRLPKEIGYFNVAGYKRGSPIPVGMRKDFDALEVYNGYDISVPSRVDEVLQDWFALLQAGHRYVGTGSSDSHRIQYQWAGYPRTVVSVPDTPSIDPLAVVAALKAGHAFVTSGPFVDFRIDGMGPGDTVGTPASTVMGHLVVRAVPWVDVTSVEIVVAGVVVSKIPVLPSTADEATTPRGSLAELRASTIRLEQDVSVPVAKLPSWVVVIVRGTRLLDDILPFMPVPPRAFTNPIWLGAKK
ncbi:hypothetical protein BH09MYX1_BH09MYX1_34000 [soil metagenome]